MIDERQEQRIAGLRGHHGFPLGARGGRQRPADAELPPRLVGVNFAVVFDRLEVHAFCARFDEAGDAWVS